MEVFTCIFTYLHTHTHKTTSLRDFLNKAKEEKSEQISTHLPLHICKYYLKNQNIGSIIVLLLRKILKRRKEELFRNWANKKSWMSKNYSPRSYKYLKNTAKKKRWVALHLQLDMQVKLHVWLEPFQTAANPRGNHNLELQWPLWKMFQLDNLI